MDVFFVLVILGCDVVMKDHSRDIRMPYFVTNDDNDDAGLRRSLHRVLPKNCSKFG